MFVHSLFAEQASYERTKFNFNQVTSLNPLDMRELELPGLVRGNKSHFNQVLVRLTKNALKFSANKAICIRTTYE